MRRLFLPALFVAEAALFSFLGGAEFHSFSEAARYFGGYLSDMLAQSMPTLLLAFGMTLVMMTGGIDLSAGSMAALVACAMASFAGGGSFWWTAVPVGLALGVALGAANGALVAGLDVPPIIATLGTMIFYRGLCFVVMGDLEKSPFLDTPGYESLGGVAAAAVLLVVVYAAGGDLFRRSRWRRELLMIGGNRIAARYAGIPVGRRAFEVYALMGLLSFLAALAFTARNSSVSASSMTGLELHVIVAVALGGTRVQGGGGTLYGTFWGALVIAALDEGLRASSRWGDEHLPFKISHLEHLLLGALLVGAVWMNARFTTEAQRNTEGNKTEDAEAPSL